MKKNEIINIKQFISEEKIKLKNLILKPLLSEKNKNIKGYNNSNNLKLSSSLKIFPLSNSKMNIKYLKNSRLKMKTAHYSSTPNINNFQQSNNNKNSILTHHTFNYKYIKPKTPTNLSLCTILATSKNKFIENNSKNNIDKNKLEKRKKIRFLMNKGYLYEYSQKNKKEKNFQRKMDLMVFLSCFNNNFINSEKIRFYNIMERFNKIKLIIEANPTEKYKVIKNFFITIGLDNQKYFNKNIMNSFLKFIQKDFIIDPSKSLKENILNIINNNNDYISYQNKLKNYGNIISSPNKTMTQRIRNILNVNKNLYKNKSLKYNSYEKYKIKRFDLDLRMNLEKQKELNIKNNKQETLDIINEPENIMNSLENKLKDDKNMKYDTTYYDYNSNLKFKDYKCIYPIKIYDLDKLKKNNLLTEYACYEKSKINLDFQNIKLKYKI